MMHITDDQYSKFQQYLSDKVLGYAITRDGICSICESEGMNANKIGKNILDRYEKIQIDKMKDWGI